MKYFVGIFALFIFMINIVILPIYSESNDFRFIELKESYFLNDEIVIKFEKITQQPCPSYDISMMKDGDPKSKITRGVEPLCAIKGPVEPYLFNAEYEGTEFFDKVGAYIIQVTLDGETITKEIKIKDNKSLPHGFNNSFSITQEHAKYVISYHMTSGIVKNMHLDCDSSSLTVNIESIDSGTLKMDLPKAMLGVIFMVTLDGQEWEDISLDSNTLTITYPKNSEIIEVKSGFKLTPSKDNDGVCDVIHNPPYSYILSPREQMKSGVPLWEIKCKEDLVAIFKVDRITPACVTDHTWNKLLQRGWTPLRMGMPAETNILITYDAIQVYPQNVTKKLDPRSPYFNLIFWVNNDVVPHTVIADDGSWQTTIASGKVGSMIFNQTGIYNYYIKENPQAIGIVDFSGLVELEDN